LCLRERSHAGRIPGAGSGAAAAVVVAVGVIAWLAQMAAAARIAALRASPAGCAVVSVGEGPRGSDVALHGGVLLPFGSGLLFAGANDPVPAAIPEHSELLRYHRAMPLDRDQITRRAARELRDGFVVNLGIGMPTLVANHIPDGMDVWLQSENGLLGIGPFPTEAEVDADLINAGKQTVTARTGASFFSSADSFAMIRGGHVDMCILGAMELSEQGDIANWMIPGKMVKGMGGAMDLVAGVERVVVTMEHCNKKGAPKILKECKLPLTGQRCIDMVITDLCVLEMDEGKQRFRLAELAPGVTKEEVIEKTEAELIVDDEPKTVEV